MNFRNLIRRFFGEQTGSNAPESGPVQLSDMLRAAAKLTDQRCYRLARQQYREISRQPLSSAGQYLLAYNRGVFAWVHLGDGIAAREHFSEAVELAKHGTSGPNREKVLANATENLMLLAVSYEEFFERASTLAKLSPEESILHQQLPHTREWQREGLPWSEVMTRRARAYWDTDPQLDSGCYACGASILHVLLANRKSLRLNEETYRTWLHTYVTLLFQHFDLCNQQVHDPENQTNVWELNLVFEPAMVLLEDYMATHLDDGELLFKLKGVRDLLMKIDHYETALSRFTSALVPLKIVQAEPDGANLNLIYQWTASLSEKQADLLDSRARAFVNSAVGIAAISQWVGCQDGPNDASLLGIPIPGWYLEGRHHPTYVVNSRFDIREKLMQLTLGMRFARPQEGTIDRDPISHALGESFKTLFAKITV